MEPKQPKVIVIDPKTGERQYVHEGDVPSVESVESLAKLMDSLFEIPGTGVRVGLDSIIGLIPGLGDTISSLVSLHILNVANQRGVSKLTMMRMATNVAVDYVVGAVPVLGDAFDVVWKANQKNVALLRQHVEANPQTKKKLQTADWIFFGVLVLLLLLVLVGSLTVAYLVITWLGSLLFAPQPLKDLSMS